MLVSWPIDENSFGDPRLQSRGFPREKDFSLGRNNFQVRDSISSPGNFVLTVRWHRRALHFHINKVLLPANEDIYGTASKAVYQVSRRNE